MSQPTHIIRFVAEEDGIEHLGQLVDTARDIGLDAVNGTAIQAYKINGSIYDGTVTAVVLTAKRLLSPITREECNFIRCLGLNYKDHAKEASMALPKAPILFCKPRTALGHPYPAAIPIPKCAQDGTSDYEAELCVIIGKSGRNIPEEEALDHVLGYTASNDVSARTLQMMTTQWSYSKGLDGSCPLGPVLVTSKALPEPQALKIKAIHKGNTVQDVCITSDMIFTIRQQIAYFSQGTTLEAGTIILTGTPAGIGHFRDPRVVLRDGDDIRVEIDGIGTLVNTVRYESW
ncbi:hypothetical protein LTR56_002392 [Elasticomyces elasticus]|nr:hypothetical protein LTR56_002392 [Elasticomyces elasticus]